MLRISPAQFLIDSRMLRAKILDELPPIDTVLIITRGGLHLGYYIAKALGIRDIQTFNVASYTDGNQQEALRDFTQHSLNLTSKSVLVIDDLIDSGATLNYVHGILAIPGQVINYATLYLKKNHRCKIPREKLVFLKEMDAEEWIEFYYEL